MARIDVLWGFGCISAKFGRMRAIPGWLDSSHQLEPGYGLEKSVPVIWKKLWQQTQRGNRIHVQG